MNKTPDMTQDIELKEFLEDFELIGDAEAAFQAEILKFIESQSQKRSSINTNLMGFVLKPNFVVMHRKQKENADANDFITKYFSNKGLKVRVDEVDAGVDADELIQFLEWHPKARHNIVVTKWADVPKKHYEYLLQNNYSIIVLERLNVNGLKDFDNLLEHGPVLSHVRQNTFVMMQYLMNRDNAVAGNNEANQQKADEAAIKYEATYNAICKVVKTESLKRSKVLTQKELEAHFNENKILDWEISQSLISRCIRKTGNYDNWKNLIKDIKAELDTRDFKSKANGKTQKDVVGFIVGEAQKSPSQSISYSILYEHIFRQPMRGNHGINQLNKIFERLHTYCVDNELPIVGTLLRPQKTPTKDHVKQNMHDHYEKIGGQLIFENADQFYDFFKELSLEFGLNYMARLPNFED